MDRQARHARHGGAGQAHFHAERHAGAVHGHHHGHLHHPVQSVQVTPPPTLATPVPATPKPPSPPPVDAQRVWNNTGTDFNAGGSWVGGTAPTTGDVAAFNSAATTQPQLSSNTSISGLYFTGTDTNGYTLTRSASQTLTLTGFATSIGAETGDSSAVAIGAENTSGTNTISVPFTLAPASGSTSTIFQATGGTLSISGVISGSGIGLTKTGGGTLTFSAANTYTGATTINGGTLTGTTANSWNNFISSSSALVLGGGTLNLNFVSKGNQTFAGLTLNAGASTIAVSNGSNGSGNAYTLSLGAITRNIGSTLDFSLGTNGTNGTIATTSTNTNGILGGYATVTNTNTGVTSWATVSGGNIIALPLASYSNGFGAAANTDIIASSSQSGININSLRFNTAGAVTLTLSGTNIIQSGGILETTTVGNNASTITGGTLEGASSKDLVVIQNNTSNSLTIGSVIADNTSATGLTKSGAGTLILTGTNTYSGTTTINTGTLQIGAGGTAGTLGSGSVTDNAALSFNRSNAISISNVISGTGSVTQAGSGTTTLTAANTYAGATTISAGTLQLGNGGTTGSLSSSSAITDNGNLTINRSNAVAQGTDFSGSAITGTGSFTQAGSGTTTLNAANTYSGATTINAGTLSLDNAGSTTARLASTSGITVNSGGTLLLASSSGSSTDRINNSATITLNGGTFNTGGLSEHGTNNNTAGIGALTLSATSIIDMGNLSSIVAFANSHLATWSGTLKIYDWTGTVSQGGGIDQLYVGSDNTGLTAAQLAEINFYSDAGTTFLGHPEILANGEIVPIPEPSTWVAGGLALATLFYTQRRRLSCLKNRRT